MNGVIFITDCIKGVTIRAHIVADECKSCRNNRMLFFFSIIIIIHYVLHQLQTCLKSGLSLHRILQ